MFQIIEGDARECLRDLPDESVQTCVTSPPYWGLRDYGVDGQLGLEPTPEEYVANLVAVFREVKRVLRDDGTLWLNLGDSYASSPPGNVRGVGETSGLAGAKSEKYRQTLVSGHATKRNTVVAGLKPKDLVGIPWMVAFALRADGWYLRSDIIWAKPNPMPESVTDRPTKAHEYLFLFSKSPRYFYDADAIRDKADYPERWSSVNTTHQDRGDGLAPTGQTPHTGLGTTVTPFRNKRSVWTVTTQPFHGAHFATFPPKLIEPCILAGSAEGDVVLDPFTGSGTTGMVALRHDRDFIGIELNPEYAQMARNRIHDDAPLLNVESSALLHEAGRAS